jgi:hypothetical protein
MAAAARSVMQQALLQVLCEGDVQEMRQQSELYWHPGKDK